MQGILIINRMVLKSCENSQFTCIFTLKRPHWADSVIELPGLSDCLSVFTPSGAFFSRPSLARRSHDQFQSLTLVPLPPLKRKKKEEKNSVLVSVLLSASVKRFSVFSVQDFCNYPSTLRDTVSPVCGILKKNVYWADQLGRHTLKLGSVNLWLHITKPVCHQLVESFCGCWEIRHRPNWVFWTIV